MNKISQIFESENIKKEQLEKKKIKRLYFSNFLAIFLGFLLLSLSLGITIYSGYSLGEIKREYNALFGKLNDYKILEEESEVKKIITKIGDSSNLVYNLSMFHISPRTVIEEVEKAIYLGPDKVYTNENMSLSNYNTITVGLITQDLENFGTLIKKLKKLYSDIFEVKGLQDFGIIHEVDNNGIKTGKVFYTTDITLKYLKNPGTNLVSRGMFDDTSEIQENKSIYENNKEGYTTFSMLLNSLAEKRKKEGKKELYVTSSTIDNSIYLGTDIEYFGKNIYYITKDNTLSDLFNLNGIGTKDDYNFLKTNDIKLLLITSQDGQNYGLCTKVLKEEDELSTLEKEDTTGNFYTKIISEGNYKDMISGLCELL